jgi:hypothetical protein
MHVYMVFALYLPSCILSFPHLLPPSNPFCIPIHLTPQIWYSFLHVRILNMRKFIWIWNTRKFGTVFSCNNKHVEDFNIANAKL